ncbi:hypothetical protein KP78_30020 [Jeotgalibacillus soli]|uniref:Uncharacterized protein n=1 Tax=Jeotgalibacillus soli TaxID=889306 RepID=A0A0C2VN79_9BACL|nr:hypothetical protein KP78_30020 [Jeotgalibacillus soli]
MIKIKKIKIQKHEGRSKMKRIKLMLLETHRGEAFSDQSKFP